jgi:hypothetical protein
MAAKLADKSLFVVSKVFGKSALFKRRIWSKKSSCHIIEYVKVREHNISKSTILLMSLFLSPFRA